MSGKESQLILVRKDVPPNPINIQKNSTPLLSEQLKQLIDSASELATPGEALVREKGKKIYGSGRKCDPFGPTFQTNLVQAHRYLKFSTVWPLRDEGGAPTGETRMTPIDFRPVKPRKENVDPASYRKALKQHRPTLPRHWAQPCLCLAASQVRRVGTRRRHSASQKYPFQRQQGT